MAKWLSETKYYQTVLLCMFVSEVSSQEATALKKFYVTKVLSVLYHVIAYVSRADCCSEEQNQLASI